MRFEVLFNVVTKARGIINTAPETVIPLVLSSNVVVHTDDEGMKLRTKPTSVTAMKMNR